MKHLPPFRPAAWLRRGLGLALLAVLMVSAHAADLTVSAAASLTNAFKDLGPMFEAANPGTKMLFNFGASGALLQQIAKGGAPVDVFASADQETMDQAQSQGLVRAAQRRDFVSNSLVVIVPASTGNVPNALSDLAQARYQRIAIGLPASVPVGRYNQGRARRGGSVGCDRAEGGGGEQRAPGTRLRGACRGRCRLRLFHRCGAHARQGQDRSHGADAEAHPVSGGTARCRRERRDGDEVRRLPAVGQAQTVLAKYGFERP
jgi:hypothetical protein